MCIPTVYAPFYLEDYSTLVLLPFNYPSRGIVSSQPLNLPVRFDSPDPNQERGWEAVDDGAQVKGEESP